MSDSSETQEGLVGRGKSSCSSRLILRRLTREVHSCEDGKVRLAADWYAKLSWTQDREKNRKSVC